MAIDDTNAEVHDDNARTDPKDMTSGDGEKSETAAPTPPFMSPSTNGLMPEKRFDGKGYKVWKGKMEVFLFSMKLHRYLKEDPPVIHEGATDVYTIGTLDAWNQGDYMAKGWILGRLSEQLYDLYCDYTTAKSLWLSLEKKYKAEDAGCQKHATAKFHEFMMVDEKPIMDQVEAFQRICKEIATEGMTICEVFTVNSFIEKLPPGWMSFKAYLKHKRKVMSLEDLIQRIRTEDRNRKENGVQTAEHTVNVAVHKGNAADKGKGKAVAKSPLKPTSKNFKKQAPAGPSEKKFFKGKCHTCGKNGHRSSDCRNKKFQAQLTEEDMCAVVTEVNMVDDNPVEWWYDTGATTHICNDRKMFTTYQKSKSEEQLFMGNTTFSKIAGSGSVILRFTSGHEITLKNVKHVPDMRKNLISGTLMSKAGFAVVFESNSLVLNKYGL